MCLNAINWLIVVTRITQKVHFPLRCYHDMDTILMTSHTLSLTHMKSCDHSLTDMWNETALQQVNQNWYWGTQILAHCHRANVLMTNFIYASDFTVPFLIPAHNIPVPSLNLYKKDWAKHIAASVTFTCITCNLGHYRWGYLSGMCTHPKHTHILLRTSPSK